MRYEPHQCTDLDPFLVHLFTMHAISRLIGTFTSKVSLRLFYCAVKILRTETLHWNIGIGNANASDADADADANRCRPPNSDADADIEIAAGAVPIPCADMKIVARKIGTLALAHADGDADMKCFSTMCGSDVAIETSNNTSSPLVVM